MNIIDYLTKPGNFVRTPDDRVGCVIRFNATTNEVEITYGAIGLAQSLARSLRQEEQFLEELREQGLLVTHHFDKLRIGTDPHVAQGTGT